MYIYIYIYIYVYIFMYIYLLTYVDFYIYIYIYTYIYIHIKPEKGKIDLLLDAFPSAGLYKDFSIPSSKETANANGIYI
jgi:hypothetical protein